MKTFSDEQKLMELVAGRPVLQEMHHKEGSASGWTKGHCTVTWSHVKKQRAPVKVNTFVFM